MPLFVQAASNTGGASFTVTLGSNTTANDCLVACIALGNASATASVASVKLGGVADNFAQLKAVGDLAVGAEQLATWADPSCAGNQTAVAIALNVALVGLAWVFEFSGVAASNVLDQSATFDSAGGTNSTFSVTSGTTTQASEVAVGCVYGFNTTITGPSSPWVNESTITSTTRTLQASYNILSSTQAVTYSGSFGAAAFNGQIVVTLKGTAATAVGQLQPWSTVPVPRRRLARAVVQSIIGRPPPAAPNRELPLIPQPRPLRRAFVHFITGQPPPAAPNKEPPPGPRPRPPRRAYVQHVTGSFPPAVTLGTANREPFQPSRARGPQRAVTRSITGTPPPVFRVTRAQQPGLPLSRRPARAVVLSVQPQPVVAAVAAPGGMRDRHPGYLKKRILFGM